jgi:hypothetical protein
MWHRVVRSPATVLSGLGGDDALWGNGGKDKGGDCDDTLRGGLANDRLKGGADDDSFLFSTKLHKKKNVDKIADFSHKDDTIILDNAIFRKLKDEGELKGKFFEIGKEADDKNDYVSYDRETDVLSYDSDGSKNKIKSSFRARRSPQAQGGRFSNHVPGRPAEAGHARPGRPAVQAFRRETQQEAQHVGRGDTERWRSRCGRRLRGATSRDEGQ